LTGFSLFVVLYLFNAGTFLIDKTIHDWSAGAAITTALGFLVAFWLVYDLICRSLGSRKHGDLWVGLLVFLTITVASWAACQLFAGRAAFLLVGAMIATAMSANVFFWIIPGQRTVIQQLRAGEAVDPIHGQRGKQRSVHNTYFTLPVLVAMLSNHYGWLYQGRQNWLVLVLLMVAGALIRHSFVARHKAHVLGHRTPWEQALAGVVILIGMAVWLAPPPTPQASSPSGGEPQAAAAPISFVQVNAILEQRCVTCHNAQVQNKNVALHTPELIRQHAQNIYQQAVVLKVMPMNNATQITDAERGQLRRWFEQGAPTQ
jgi:uncharacterized membrane protein